MVTLEQLALRLVLTHDGLEDAQQRLGEEVLEVVVRIDRDVVVHRVDGILGFLIGFRVFWSLDHDVSHAVSDYGRGDRIANGHLLGELDVWGVDRVVLGRLRQ